MNKSTKKNLTWLALGAAVLYYFTKSKDGAGDSSSTADTDAPARNTDLGNDTPTVTVNFDGDNPGLTTFNNGPTV